MGDQTVIIYPQKFKPNGGKWAFVFLERGKIVCQLLFGQPVPYGAAKSRKLVIHIDDYTHAAIGQKSIYILRAFLVSLQANAVADCVNAQYEIKRSKKRFLRYPQRLCQILDQIFVFRYAKANFPYLLRREVFL